MLNHILRQKRIRGRNVEKRGRSVTHAHLMLCLSETEFTLIIHATEKIGQQSKKSRQKWAGAK